MDWHPYRWFATYARREWLRKNRRLGLAKAIMRAMDHGRSRRLTILARDQRHEIR